VFVLHWTGV